MIRSEMERMPSTPVLVTKPEAARRAGVGLRQIRRAVAAGEIPEFSVGSWPRVRWCDVEAWIARRRRDDAEAPATAPGGPL